MDKQYFNYKTELTNIFILQNDDTYLEMHTAKEIWKIMFVYNTMCALSSS